MSLTVDERLEGGWLVLGTAGEVDVFTAGEWRVHLMESLSRVTGHHRSDGHMVAPEGGEAVRGLIVDLAGISFMDSAGLGVVVGAYKRATAAPVALRLAGATDQIRTLLEQTGLIRVLPVYPSVSAARAASS